MMLFLFGNDDGWVFFMITGIKGVFRWFDYLKQTRSVAAPVRLFDKVTTHSSVLCWLLPFHQLCLLHGSIVWELCYFCQCSISVLLFLNVFFCRLSSVAMFQPVFLYRT